jgi:hypothetical protein
MGFATSLVIEDATGKRFPVPFIKPASLTINRGAEPSSLEIAVPDTVVGATVMDTFENPVKLHITTPDKYNNQKTCTLENWYIQSRPPEAPGLFRFVIYDCRIKAYERELDAEYNVTISNTTPFQVNRPSSLNNGELWTAYDAAIDAIERFGFEFEEDAKFPAELKSVLLPKNLGNHVTGGFRGAKWIFAMPTLLEVIRCDVVPTKSGKLTITDRLTRVTDSLAEYVLVDGVIGTRKQHWTHPQNIRVKFGTRAERWFFVDDRGSVSPGGDLNLLNVIPGSALSPFGPTPGHRSLEAALKSAGFNLDTVLRNWMAPILIPRDGKNLTAEDVNERTELDTYCRHHLRTLFRIESSELTTLGNIRIGHVGYDGDTVSDRCVYMPYERMGLYTQATGESLEELLSQFMSQGIVLNLQVPAPWTASATYSAAGEMIIALEVDSNPYSPYEHIPGRLENRAGRYESIRFGGVLDIADPNTSLPTQAQLKLSPRWQCYIFYHGLLLVDRPDLGLERFTTIELPMFEDGPVEYVEQTVSNLTANYRADRTNLDPGDSPGKSGIPLTLVNGFELQERAELVRDQMKRNFEEGQAGIAYTAGVDALVAGEHWVRGNVNSMTILFGSDKPYTIKCQWVAMPEVEAVLVDGKLDGAPTMTLG